MQAEDGIDGGGLFKEFMTKLTEKIFDPHYPNFTETEKDRCIYPNVLATKANPEFRAFFEFFGLIVGKAIYEGVLLKYNFAQFFLNKIVNKSN